MSGIAAVLALAARRGPLDPATLGGAAAALPDLEHILPFPGSGGRLLFPSYRRPVRRSSGELPAWVQLVAAGAVLATLVRRQAPRSRRRSGSLS